MLSRLALIATLAAALIGGADQATAGPRRLARLRVQRVAAVEHVQPVESHLLKQVIYPVADLVVPVPSRANLEVEPLPRLRRNDEPNATQQLKGARSAPGNRLLPEATLERQLMELVRNKIAPSSWQDRGGIGSVQYYPLGMSLVVSQTPAVHEEVLGLLESLRRQQDLETALELRVMIAAPTAFEMACANMKLARLAEKDNAAAAGPRTIAPKGKRWTSFLDQEQARQLLETLQKDRATTIMQAPKLTLFNGQNVALEVLDQRFLLTSIQIAQPQDSDDVFFVPTQSPWLTGLSLGIQATLAADRQSVRVRMKGYWSQLAGPVELQPVEMPIKTKNEQGNEEANVFRMYLQRPKFAQVRLDDVINVGPNAGTALINCGVVPMEVAREDLIAQINKFMGGEMMTTSADRQVFFLITPRAIINDEEEAAVSINPPTARP